MTAVEVWGVIDFRTSPDGGIYKVSDGWPQRCKFTRILVEASIGGFLSYDEGKRLIDVKLANGRGIYSVVDEDGGVLTGRLRYSEDY